MFEATAAHRNASTAIRENFFKKFARDNSGHIAMMFALSFPVISLSALAALDLTSIIHDESEMQAAADLGALNAAGQLSVDGSTNTASRAIALTRDKVQDLINGGWQIDVNAAVVQKGAGIQISISGHRDSFFHNLLPMGGWSANVQATAIREGLMPLCVLAFKDGLKDAVHVQDKSTMDAPGCLVQSNNDIHIDSTAKLSAGMIQAWGTSRGISTPEAETGAPKVDDPFAAVPISIPSTCTDSDLDYTGGSNTLNPGVHCGDIIVEKFASLTLAPGEHYFANGHFQVKDSATVDGTDIVLIFDKTTHLDFNDKATISLEGRTSGQYAGFVIASARLNSQNFTISATSARKLLGVVYIPNGTLTIQGDSKVADASAWTVIVAYGVHLSGGPDLVVNSNYAASTVPVPTGVGPSTATSRIRLTQ